MAELLEKMCMSLSWSWSAQNTELWLENSQQFSGNSSTGMFSYLQERFQEVISWPELVWILNIEDEEGCHQQLDCIGETTSVSSSDFYLKPFLAPEHHELR